MFNKKKRKEKKVGRYQISVYQYISMLGDWHVICDASDITDYDRRTPELPI